MEDSQIFLDKYLNREQRNLFFVLKNFVSLRMYGFKRYYASSSGPEVFVEISSLRKNVKIRFLWSGNSGLQIYIMKSYIFNNKEINIMDLSQNEYYKKTLFELNECEDIDMVLEKYSAFFNSEIMPFLKENRWI